MLGLSSVDMDVTFQTIQYAIYTSSNGMLGIYENGISVVPATIAFTASDLLRVERSGSNIFYKKNGVVMYASSVPTNSTLYADCSLQSVGASFTSVSIVAGKSSTDQNVTLSGTTLTKTSGTSGQWDGGAFSTNYIPDNTNAYIEFSAGQTNTDKIMGLSTVDGGIDNQSIEYGLTMAADGNLYVNEKNGVHQQSLGAYATSDVLRVERRGTSIYYKKNNNILYTSLITSVTGALYADCSFSTASASINNLSLGIAQIKLVSYEYNELGQLVDKKLYSTDGSTFLQSLDYRYDIQGRITSLNNAQLTSDGILNDETNDYFGMEYLYQTQQAGLTGSADVVYNGNLSAVKWKAAGTSAGAADQKSYKFSYDNVNRLKTATFQQSTTATAWGKEAGVQSEWMSYDLNGNIIYMNRRQRKNQSQYTYVAESIDALNYTYSATQGDQLLKVTDAATGTLAAGFDNGTSGSGNDYTYDNHGNLTKDKNKGIDSIAYNYLGKPTVIIYSDGRRVNYTYDAAGTKLTLKAYAAGGTLQNTTDYIDSYVYENSTLSFFSSPEGRIVNNAGTLEYQYSISDQQGNTRVVFTSAAQTPQATFTDFEATTNTDFKNYTNRISMNLYDHTDAGTVDTYTQLLTGGNNSQVGVARSYPVYPGDKIKIEAYAKYANPTSAPNDLMGSFAGALLGAFGVTPPGVGETGTAAYALNYWGGVVGSGGDGESASAPHVSVNILVFDKNFNFLDAAFDQIDASAKQVGATPVVNDDYLSSTYTIKEAGYVFVYVANENPTQVEAYFDDVKMTYTPTNIVQYNEYYPYGMQANTSWTRSTATGNKFLANGGTEINTTTGWYDLAYRNYDASLGRFMQVDPLATKYASLGAYHYSFNNPVMLNDPSGAGPGDGPYNPYGYYNANGQWNWRPDIINPGPSDPGAARMLSTFENTQRVAAGPVVYNKWDNNYVNAYDVLAYNPTYQNKEYRQSAVDAIAKSLLPQTLQAGIWTSGTDGFDKAGVYLGLKGLGVDLAAESWKYASNASKWKQAYEINRTLKGSLFLKANGINVPKTSLIKAGIPGVLKGVGIGLGLVSGAVTVTQVIYNGEIKASNVLDATMTGLSFIPGAGWMIGGGYFLLDVGVRLATDKSIGEHLDESIGNGGSLLKF